MGKAILFRTILATLSVIGGICFIEGYYSGAIILWALAGIVLFFGFRYVEGIPSSRVRRIIIDVVPMLFFVLSSGLGLILKKNGNSHAWLMISCIVIFYLAIIFILIKGGKDPNWPENRG